MSQQESWFSKLTVFFILIPILLVFEGVSRHYMPFRHNYPTVADEPKCPIADRGWPEYLDYPRNHAKKNVAIISSSQTYAPEYVDASSNWFPKVQKMFATQDTNIVLENWSVGGQTVPEMEVLTTKAIVEDMDYMFIGMQVNNFLPPPPYNLGQIDTDSPLLFADPRTWKYTNDMVLTPHLKSADLVSVFMRKNSDLVRMRSVVHDWIYPQIPKPYRIFLFGTDDRIRRANLSTAFSHPLIATVDVLQEEQTQLEIKKKSFEDAHINKFQGTRKNKDLAWKAFTAFHNNLMKRIGHKKIKVIYLWMPYCSETYTDDTKALEREFNAEAKAYVQNCCTSYDLSSALPPDMFITRSHFSKQGHDSLSKVMFPIITKEVQ